MASVNADGSISLVEGSPDIGGSRAAMAMQIAEVLGISPDDVTPSIGDTDSIGYSSGAGGSGVTFKTGMASVEAAKDIRHQMIERAARIWDVDVDEVDYSGAIISHKSDSELKITFQELANMLNACAVQIVDVKVDPETGKVDILRFTALQDVGKAIHPSYVEGQLQGAAAQGVGWALNEEYYFDDKGRMQNPTFLDYRMPTALDLPMIDTVLIEVSNSGHPFGVRGVGEACLVPTMAAVANAIHKATGVRMGQLPMNPTAVLAAMAARDNE